MLGTSRGIIPAGKRLLPLILLMAASAPIAATAMAELAPVLSFYRRELGARNWTEETAAPSSPPTTSR